MPSIQEKKQQPHRWFAAFSFLLTINSCISTYLPREIIRVVLLVCTLVLVQPTYRFHVFWRQLKIKDSDILASVVIIVATLRH